MNALDTTIASLANSRLTLGEFLGRLQVQARLAPLVREALTQQYLLDQARAAGLAVTVAELQQAANAYRRNAGLHSAAATHAWFTQHGLSVDDFEAGLEESLLVAKLRQQRGRSGVEVHFATHLAAYERLRLALLVAPRDDLARELASQVRDEGRELEAVAAEHDLPVIHRELLRKELGGTQAAALAAAKAGELVGPLATPQGFTLMQILERHEPALDPPLRRTIEQELFQNWLAENTKESSLDLNIVRTA